MPRSQPPHRTPALIRSRLQKGEEIRWTGRPVPRHFLWSGIAGGHRATQALSLTVILLFSLFFSIPGAVFVRASASVLLDPASSGSTWVAAATLPLALLGALLPQLGIALFALANHRKARRLHYVLTQRRALILEIRDGEIVDSRHKDLRSIRNAKLLRVRRDGIGDVVFDSDGEAAGIDSAATHVDVGFLAVPDAPHVHALLSGAGRSDIPMRPTGSAA